MSNPNGRQNTARKSDSLVRPPPSVLAATQSTPLGPGTVTGSQPMVVVPGPPGGGQGQAQGNRNGSGRQKSKGPTQNGSAKRQSQNGNFMNIEGSAPNSPRISQVPGAGSNAFAIPTKSTGLNAFFQKFTNAGAVEKSPSLTLDYTEPAAGTAGSST